MSTKELMKALEKDDLHKLYEAKKFSEQASRNQYALFSFNKVKALYLEIAKKYRVDLEQIKLLVKSLDASSYFKANGYA
jgi:hypothetical protein